MINYLIVGILNQSRIHRDSSLWQWVPFVLAVALDRQVYAILGSTSPEPPLTLRELVEATQVGTTAVALAQIFLTPLREHPVHVESIEARTRNAEGAVDIGTLEVTLAHLVDILL